MTSPAHEHYSRYVEYIRKLLQSPGTAATLRSAAGRDPDAAFRAAPFIEPWLTGPYADFERASYYTVTGLMARLDSGVPGTDTVPDIVAAEDFSQSLANQMMAFARADATGARRRLLPLLTRLDKQVHEMDWALLLSQLLNWDRNKVGVRWLQQYHRTLAVKNNKTEPSTTETGEIS